jgi:AcrR family transcriptional regulator
MRAMADVSDGPVWARPRPEPRRRAPSVERIVERSIAIADAEGMAAVSMRRVAAELGSGTASLYRYVRNRDELVELMVDAAWGWEGSEPSGDWRCDLTAVARSLRSALLQHPWLSAEVSARPTFGPNSLRRSDAALAAATALTPDITLAAQVVATAMAYVRGAVAVEIAEEQASRRTGLTKEQWQRSLGSYIRGVVDSGEYPHLARSIVEGDDPVADERFEFGLGCVLDGLAARAAGSAWTTARRLDR